MQATQQTRKKWHVARWPLLAWLETMVKLVALGIGVWALVSRLPAGALAWPAGGQRVQLIVLVVLSLGLVAAIYDRLLERELVAMGFVLVNNLGHWGMVAYLLMGPADSTWLTVFAALMAAGDLVKIGFLYRHNFQVRDTPPAVLYGLTGFYLLGYLVILALELIG